MSSPKRTPENSSFADLHKRSKPESSVPRALTSLDELHSSGEFRRQESSFRHWIQAQEDAEFPAESGRYHLYISFACPWANRVLAVLYLKGLEDAIGVSAVHPTWQRTRPEDPQDLHTGWVFRAASDPPVKPLCGFGEIPCDSDCIPDYVNQCDSIRSLYLKADEAFAGKPTVPVLWDKVKGTIVNNESSEIIRMLNSEFDAFAKNPDVNLYPPMFKDDIDEVNKWVYKFINNGVYKCGFAQSQAAYDSAVEELYVHLDRAEDILSDQRYLCGDLLTEADIRLFMTLVRFDEVYVVYFKCNNKRILDYHNLRNFCRDLYQVPEIGRTINMDHIKQHYFTSHPNLNHYGIIPVGPGVIEDLQMPHDRDRFESVIEN